MTGRQPSETGLCNSGHPSRETERTAVFDGPSPNSEIAENLYGLASTSAARAAFAYQISHATCTTYRPPNTPFTLTIRSLSLAKVGQRSMAWQATITNAQTGVTQNGDVMLIQQGRYNVGLIDRTTTTVNTGLFRTTAREALADVVHSNHASTPEASR